MPIGQRLRPPIPVPPLSPTIPGGAAPQLPSEQQVQVNVNLSGRRAVDRKVFSQQILDAMQRVSDVFDWSQAGPLAIHTVNTHDQPFTVRVNVHHDPNTGQPLHMPVLEFDVGVREHVHPTVDPEAGDMWGPWAWVTVQAAAPPTQGQIDVTFIALRGASE